MNNLEDMMLFIIIKEALNSPEKDIIKKIYKKNDFITIEGEEADYIYIVLDGLVKIFKTEENGRKKTLNYLNVGDFFGESAIIDGNLRSVNIQAIKNTLIYEIKRNKFNELLKNYPQITLKIILSLSKRLREANEEITKLAFNSVKKRLFNELKRLAKNFGEKKDKGILITEKITHKDLAELVGTSRETVTKYLGEMIKEGVIKIIEKQIFLPFYKSDEELA